MKNKSGGIQITSLVLKYNQIISLHQKHFQFLLFSCKNPVQIQVFAHPRPHCQGMILDPPLINHIRIMQVDIN